MSHKQQTAAKKTIPHQILTHIQIEDLESLLPEDLGVEEIKLKTHVEKKTVPLFEIELVLTDNSTGRLDFAPDERTLKTRLEVSERSERGYIHS